MNKTSEELLKKRRAKYRGNKESEIEYSRNWRKKHPNYNKEYGIKNRERRTVLSTK